MLFYVPHSKKRAIKHYLRLKVNRRPLNDCIFLATQQLRGFFTFRAALIAPLLLAIGHIQYGKKPLLI
jgi:hypothetical protein